jgi:hypothetical protein
METRKQTDPRQQEKGQPTQENNKLGPPNKQKNRTRPEASERYQNAERKPTSPEKLSKSENDAPPLDNLIER